MVGYLRLTCSSVRRFACVIFFCGFFMLSVQFEYVLFRVVLCGFVRVHSCVVFCECTMCFKVILHSVGVGCCLCRCVVHDSAGACMRAIV